MIDDLLKVLDMSEKEQRAWLGYYLNEPHITPCSHKGCLNHLSHPCEGCGRIAGHQPYRESLADLAFRLRDEVDEIRFKDGLYQIKKHLKIETQRLTAWQIDYWGMLYAKPIHWIIAALIAQRLAKEKK